MKAYYCANLQANEVKLWYLRLPRFISLLMKTCHNIPIIVITIILCESDIPPL